MNLEVKDGILKYLQLKYHQIRQNELVLMNQAIKVDIKKGKEAVEKCTFAIKDIEINLDRASKQCQTQASMLRKKEKQMLIGLS